MAGSQLKERLLRVINRLDRYSGLMSAVASVVIAILVVQVFPLLERAMGRHAATVRLLTETAGVVAASLDPIQSGI
jgi:hypothetical protein